MSTRYPRPRDRGPAAPATSSSAALLHRGPQAAAPGAYAAAAIAAGAYLPPAPNAALLIDFDNVTMGIQKDLQAELRSLLSSDIIKGKVSVQRAYADWRRYPNYVVPLTENSIDLIFAPAYGAAKKNATDIRLAIDAMELVFTRPEIGTFILLSGDSDFSSLVIKLKEYGKYVIGVGIRESASDLLVQNCDEYYSYNALAGLVRTADEPQAPRDPWELVVEAVDRMARNGDTMRADRLKQVMQDMDPSFDEKNLGMPKFSRFVSDAAQRGLLTLTRLESGQYEIAPARPGAARDASRDRDRGRDFSRDRDAGRDRDASRDASRDAGRDASRDASRDPSRDRETPRQSPRDVARDFARDLARDPVRDAAPMFDPTDAELADRAFVDSSIDEGAAEDDAPSEQGARDRFDRGRSRRRGRGRSGREYERGTRTDEFAVPTADDAAEDRAPAVAREPAPRDLVPLPVAPTIGISGERLTRAEAFDLVRRGVEALSTGDNDRVPTQPLREQVFALLGRDSESLSERMFPRIVQDAADNGIVRTFRDGDTITAARVPRPTPTAVGPASSDADVVAQPTPAPAPPVTSTPAAPRGMGPRGGTRGRGGRLGAPPPELLLIGAVQTGAAPGAPTNGSAAAEPAAPTSTEAQSPAAQSSTAQPTTAQSTAESGDGSAASLVDTSPRDALAVDASPAEAPPSEAFAGEASSPVASPAVDTVPVGDADDGGAPDGTTPSNIVESATAPVTAGPVTAGPVTSDATAPAPASDLAPDAAEDVASDGEPESAADDDATPARGRRRGRGRGRGAGRAEPTASAATPAPEAAPPEPEPVPPPQPAADDNAAPARGRGARKAAAKAPAKTAAKRGARKRPANAPDSGT